ncbi:hypothetical protein ACHAO7_011705 [Fusarium culmorum]
MVALKSFLLFCALSAEALAAAAPAPNCATALGPNSVKSVPTATTTVVEKITIVKKFIRKVKVIVVPRSKTTIVKVTEYTTTTEIADAAIKTATSVITSPRDIRFVSPKRLPVPSKKPPYSTKTTTITVQGPRVTLKAAIKTVMPTVYSTITTVSYPPDVSTTTTTTIYPTTTSWTSTTSTSTVTNTVTIESDIPTATTYAVCSSKNIVSTANNGGCVVAWKNVAATDNKPTFLGSGFTPETCCIECQKRPFYRVTLFDNSSANCFVYVTGTSNTCANGAQPFFGSYVTSTTAPQTPRYIFSNGPCGALTNGGGS